MCWTNIICYFNYRGRHMLLPLRQTINNSRGRLIVIAFFILNKATKPLMRRRIRHPELGGSAFLIMFFTGGARQLYRCVYRRSEWTSTHCRHQIPRYAYAPRRRAGSRFHTSCSPGWWQQLLSLQFSLPWQCVSRTGRPRTIQRPARSSMQCCWHT